MNFTGTLFTVAIGSVGIMSAMSAHAVALNNGDVFFIHAGVPAYDDDDNWIGISSGSWFAMDTNGNSKISGVEKIALSQGSQGLIIGMATSPGASHAGMPTGGDTNGITAPWSFFANTGSEYTTIGITGSTEAGLNMSGWTVTWNGIPSIPLGSGAWGAGFSNGVGNFVWNGTYGSFYTLDYHATVPLGDPSGFGGVQYALHLEGCGPMTADGNEGVVCAIPEASTYAMMLAGLGLLGVAVRRRNR
jgi:hypothetical protein